MNAPSRLDPLLVFLDFLHAPPHGARRMPGGRLAWTNDLVVFTVYRSTAVRLNLEFEEGADHTRDDHDCPLCGGSGWRACPDCRANGRVLSARVGNEKARGRAHGAECPSCAGTGSLPCRQTYKPVQWEVLDPSLSDTDLLVLIREAWSVPGQHIYRARTTSSALVNALRRGGLVDKKTGDEILRVSREAAAWVSDRRPGTRLFRRVEATVSDAGAVIFGTARFLGEFWAVG
ncbi:MAG: hypothetical protein QHJ73_10125, partial [Armatimonadota bacterium]|nr:hypothetical protein [Armatimonadota bacterium]